MSIRQRCHCCGKAKSVDKMEWGQAMWQDLYPKRYEWKTDMKPRRWCEECIEDWLYDDSFVKDTEYKWVSV